MTGGHWTNSGRNLMRNLLTTGSGEYVSYMSCGSDGTAATTSDTALGSEEYSNTITTLDTTTDYETKAELWVPSTEAVGKTLQEVALMTSTGSCVARYVHTAINKTNDVEVLYEYKIEHQEGS